FKKDYQPFFVSSYGMAVVENTNLEVITRFQSSAQPGSKPSSGIVMKKQPNDQMIMRTVGM
ncbi:MAG: hypothetical protein O2964_18905, partial [Verrucomicrobia bacterium]|nr:hypothetical protein [Verrucomicrobiota bacterium]